ncbi:MAG: hypothetical protein NT023_08655 [Armatimonadetes bacterium]|nr:hypothetical protein [Armatimonadota bacterium]
MTKLHNVSSFDCQNTYLNGFLQGKALREATRDLSLTFVLMDEAVSSTSVIGYFTLRSDSYYPDDNSEVDIVPVVELVALARDRTRYKQGIGDFLLIEALRNVKLVADLIGIAGLHLAPTREGRRLYYRYNFAEHPLSYRTDLLFLPISTIREIIRSTEE